MAATKRTAPATSKKSVTNRTAPAASAKAAAKRAAPAKRSAPASSKKSAAPKAAPAAAPAWSTIHIFGYGESQVIGTKANGKVANGELKALPALYTALAKKQQKGTRINLADTHALNIFNGSFVDYRPRGAGSMGQRLPWADVDTKAINKLADELISKAPKDTAHKGFMARLTENKKPAAAKRSATAPGKSTARKSK